MKTKVIIILTLLLSMLFQPHTHAKDNIRYYKYEVFNNCYLHVYKKQLNGASSNKGFFYKVTLNDRNQYEVVETFKNSALTDKDRFTYDDEGKIESIIDYSVIKRKTSIDTISIFEWDKDGSYTRHDYDKNNKLTEVRKLVNIGKGKKKYIVYDANLKEKWHGILVSFKDNILTSYTYHPTSIKYYYREISPDTGQIEVSKCYVNGSFKFMQIFDYSTEGITKRTAVFDEGGKYSESQYDKFGNITVEYYTFSGGHSKSFNHRYDNDHNLIQIDFFKDDKFICFFKYNRGESQKITSTEILDKDGNLLATYPNAKVRYLNADLTDKEGRKGTIFTDKKLWE